jgi:uncharacterized protein (TIGR02466 family)
MTGTVERLFATCLYRADGAVPTALLGDLEGACVQIAQDDAAGRRWSAKHGYAGYTSYASLDDLAWRDPAFKALTRVLDGHAKAFAGDLAFDLKGRRLTLDSLWINVLEPGGMHSGHIHPHSVLSGTVYVAVPEGASAIRFEDPRLAAMMAAPPRKTTGPRDLQPFVSVAPAPGTVLLWESWLRHEVVLNRATAARISISFNYAAVPRA